MIVNKIFGNTIAQNINGFLLQFLDGIDFDGDSHIYVYSDCVFVKI